MQYVYPAVLTPEDEGGFRIFAPDFEGCITSGETVAEAIYNIRDGISGFLYILTNNNEIVPGPSSPREIKAGPDDIVTLVDIDLGAYVRQQNIRAVKRTVSIPQWLDEMATSAGISLSQITQDALRRELHIK